MGDFVEFAPFDTQAPTVGPMTNYSGNATIKPDFGGQFEVEILLARTDPGLAGGNVRGWSASCTRGKEQLEPLVGQWVTIALPSGETGRAVVEPSLHLGGSGQPPIGPTEPGFIDRERKP